MQEWPEGSQEKILRMLRRAPLTDLLTLDSYTPAHATYVIPTTAVKQIPTLVAA